MRHRTEYAAVWLILKTLGVLPRPAARLVGAAVSRLLYHLTPSLRRVADRNLQLALPNLSSHERNAVCAGVYRSLGRLLTEFAQFPNVTSANIMRLIFYDGLENYRAAVAAKRGVLFLTAHLGAWELGAFGHAAHGYPLNVLYRPLDNPLLDGMINHYRSLSGNKMVDKRESVRPILAALARNETVGILADQNTLPEEGVFVNFFGTPACTTAGIARIALRTGAAVVPAFCVWDAEAQRFRIIFHPMLEFHVTGNQERDVLTATQTMTDVVEAYIRKYPDQWLWIHRRWKTRPPGEPPIYS